MASRCSVLKYILFFCCTVNDLEYDENIYITTHKNSNSCNTTKLQQYYDTQNQNDDQITNQFSTV